MVSATKSVYIELQQQQTYMETFLILWKKRTIICRIVFGSVNVIREFWLSRCDCYHDGDCIDDDSFKRRLFFFFAKLSRPLSVFESWLSESSLDELELDEDDDDELEPLELSIWV